MFAASLSQIEPFAGNNLYEPIVSEWVSGDPVIGDDCTMLAVLRCLLHPRSDTRFHLHVFHLNRKSAVHASSSAILSDFTGNALPELENNTLYVFNFRNQEAFTQNIKLLESAEENPWTADSPLKVLRVKPAEEYITSRLRAQTAIFVFPEKLSAVIFAYNLEPRAAHLLASFTPIYFPAIFKAKPITEDEKFMLEGLTMRDPDQFMQGIAKLAEPYDFRDQIIEKNLIGFEKRNRTIMLNAAKENFKNSKEKVDNIAQMYKNALSEMDGYLVRCEGLQRLIDSSASTRDLADYFLRHKGLKLLNIEGSSMSFIVNSFIDSYDTEAYEHFKQSKELYRHYESLPSAFEEEKDVALFMDNIFSETPLLKIKTCAYYRIDLCGDVQVYSDYDYSTYPECRDRIPNPHLQFHACLGDNRMHIQTQLAQGEVLGAIECCIASSMAVNIHETGMTFRPFMEKVMKSRKKIIFNTETKQDMTPQKALEWLKERAAQQAA